MVAVIRTCSSRGYDGGAAAKCFGSHVGYRPLVRDRHDDAGVLGRLFSWNLEHTEMALNPHHSGALTPFTVKFKIL